MKKRLFIGILVALALLACSREKTGVSGKGIIPRSKFVNILVDIHMMDAITNSPEFYRKFDPKDSVDVHTEIFKKYDVTRAEFDSTFVAYTRHPEAYIKVYDDVILKLNLKMDSLKDNKPSFKKEENPKERTRE